MSLPNYLARIKSSGFYRFVWDKSVIQPQQAEILRLLVGYSEKGPFNTPVYIESIPEFINIFGGISKRLEKRGVYFHRLAIQALSFGPILVLNLKPFNIEEEHEKTDTLTFDPANMYNYEGLHIDQKEIVDLYDRNRFWHIDADHIPEKIGEDKSQYINIINTDIVNNSCSMFIRKYKPTEYRGLTFRDWYAMNPLEEAPEYMDKMMDKMMDDYFAEVYTFRGEFLPELCKEGGALEDYFEEMPAPASVTVASNTTNPKKTSSGAASSPSTTQGPQVKKIEAQYIIKRDYKDAFGVKADALDALALDPRSRFVSKTRGILIPYFKDASGNYISLDVLFDGRNYDHKMLMKFNDDLLEDPEQDFDELFNVKENDGILAPIYIKGYTYKSIKPSDKGMTLQKKILGVLDTEKGIRTALTNRVDVEYHYIVDTLQSYIDDSGCKSRLSLIAKEKDNAFAILNMPPMAEFSKSSKFKDDDGNFEIEKMAEPINGFSLASEINGGSWCAYFSQLTFSDGTMKYFIPSAGLVSNNFMAKYEGRQPYYIVAGPNYGVVNYDGMVGPDYNYGRSDLDVLEPMGVNAIIYVPRKGTFINSNQTAKQIPLSALSKIHIRELVIYLQNEIEYMLQNYQWELNTQTLRDTIKSKADYILDNIKGNGGIYKYISICDETNNTPEVIDNEMVILDIEIEPARGAGKMVQTLTIHRTGGISSVQ